MKRGTRKENTQKEIAPTDAADGIALTTGEIRYRAAQIFLARAGAPGNQLDDWLLAEQELKRERARAHLQAQANHPREDL